MNSESLIIILYFCIGTTSSFAILYETEKRSLKTRLNLKENQDIATLSFRREKRSDEDSLHITLNAFNTDHQVKLVKPRHSIFSPKFEFHHVDVDVQTKERIVRDLTPTAEEMNSIEENHYVSRKDNAALMVNTETGQIHGTLKDLSIHTITNKDSRDGTTIVATKLPQKYLSQYLKNDVILPPGVFLGKRKIKGRKAGTGSKAPPAPPEKVSIPQFFNNDVILPTGVFLGKRKIMGRKAGKKPKAPPAPRKKVSKATPELMVAFDYKMFQNFKHNVKEITSYAAIFFRAVNNRFLTMDDPKIKFSIVRIFTTTYAAQQPYVGYNTCVNVSDFKNFPKTYTMERYETKEALAGFARWVVQLEKGKPQSDMAIMIFAADLQAGRNCIFWDNLAGMAYARGCCTWYNKYAVTDDNGRFTGVITACHELAHNLGAGHDNEGGCPADENSIMGGGGESPIYRKSWWSKCSQAQMKYTVDTKGFECLNTLQFSEYKFPPQAFPEGKTINDLCKRVTGEKSAVAGNTQTPEQHCANLNCVWWDSKGTFHDENYGIAIDDVMAGPNCTCYLGKCLTKTGRIFWRQ